MKLAKLTLILLGVFMSSVNVAKGQIKVIPSSKNGFIGCILEDPFDETSWNSMHIYIKVKEHNFTVDNDTVNNPSVNLLIMIHELYKIEHKYHQNMTTCSFGQMLKVCYSDDAPILVTKEEMTELLKYKKEKSSCEHIQQMPLDQFINTYFERRTQFPSGICLKPTLNLSREERDCIYIKLFENRIVNGTGDESPELGIVETPCYMD